MRQAFRIARRSLLVLAVVCMGLYVFTYYQCTTRSANGLAIWSIDDGALFIHEGPGRATYGSQTTISFPRGGYPCPSQFEFGKRTPWKSIPPMWSTIYPLWPLVAVILVPTIACYAVELWRLGVLVRTGGTSEEGKVSMSSESTDYEAGRYDELRRLKFVSPYSFTARLNGKIFEEIEKAKDGLPPMFKITRADIMETLPVRECSLKVGSLIGRFFRRLFKPSAAKMWSGLMLCIGDTGTGSITVGTSGQKPYFEVILTQKSEREVWVSFDWGGSTTQQSPIK